MTREQARARAEALGATTTDGISKALDILVVGLGAGSKLDRAQALIDGGHPLRIIDEREFGLLAWGVDRPKVEPSQSRGGASFSIDLAPMFEELAEAWSAYRERYLSGLSTEERARVEAYEAVEKQARLEHEATEQRLYAEIERAVEREIAHREEQAKADRKAGRIGTLTEIGRPYGLSAVKVGKILDEHGLRVRVDVIDERFDSPHSIAMAKYRRDSDARQAELVKAFPPAIPTPTRKRPPPPERDRSPLHLMRGVVEGYATPEEYWIAEKVAPLIEAHVKCRS